MLLPSASRREDRPEVTLPLRKRLGIALSPGYEVGESSSTVAARPAGGLRAKYSFVATMDREIRRDPKREVGYGITDSWDEIVETLQGAPPVEAHAYTHHQMETEARLSREAWRQSMDASDLARGEAMISEMLRADQRRSTEMRELRIVDHTRQQQLIQTLTVMQSLQREVTPLLGQGQQGPVGGSAQPELLEEAGSSS
ncbi:hypothetical protein Tco_0751186 [Tanacetum coccineum]|uniref:Uncharacterized protein n=1 Tax=Tanacetum coccineum TaxID=301880 RepID=A0ABQ4Z3J4_9ASTR